MKPMYYQFVNFIQTMPVWWFTVVCLVLIAGTIACVVKFFKSYNGEQTKFIKVGTLVMGILFFALLIYFVSVRK